MMQALDKQFSNCHGMVVSNKELISLSFVPLSLVSILCLVPLTLVLDSSCLKLALYVFHLVLILPCLELYISS